MISLLNNFVRVILSCHDNGLDQDMEKVLVQRVLQKRPCQKGTTSSSESVKNQSYLEKMALLRNITQISLEKFYPERTRQRLMHYR